MNEKIPEAIKEQVKESRTAKEELDDYILEWAASQPESKYKDFPKKEVDENIKDYQLKIQKYLKEKRSGFKFHASSKYPTNYIPPKKRRK